MIQTYSQVFCGNSKLRKAGLITLVKPTISMFINR